ncbi:phosphatase PAP2 family protein [Streptomyces sp. NPDC006430]|uniref:phosphatase PAP2 family protein n=1 Tax=Streptomyces sp. NPDC006430 TaxID=3154299 RepID=UPI0033B8B2C2
MRIDGVRRTGIGCALLAAVLTALVAARWRPLLSYDDRVARSLHAHAVARPGVTGLVRVLTDWVWDPWTLRAVAALVCLWLWRRGDGQRALRIVLATATASAVQQGLKVLVGRERPVWLDPVDSAHYAAYPSGHAMTATVVCGLLLSLLPRQTATPRRARVSGPARTAWVLATVSVLGVGFTRLFLGVHWASDVVAGWLLGAAVVALALSLPTRGHRPEPAVS